MALTATVTKKSVGYAQPKLHNIAFNLVLKEGTTEVLNKDVSCNFLLGDAASEKVALITNLMQIEIDRYKAEQVIFNSTALNNAVTSIQNGLTL